MMVKNEDIIAYTIDSALKGCQQSLKNLEQTGYTLVQSADLRTHEIAVGLDGRLKLEDVSESQNMIVGMMAKQIPTPAEGPIKHEVEKNENMTGNEPAADLLHAQEHELKQTLTRVTLWNMHNFRYRTTVCIYESFPFQPDATIERWNGNQWHELATLLPSKIVRDINNINETETELLKLANMIAWGDEK